MSPLLLGLVVLLILVAIGRGWIKADPRKLERQLRTIGGILALAAGAFFSAVGREIIGVPLVVIGTSLLGGNALAALWPGAARGPTRPARLTSAYLDVLFDPARGALAGRVVAGQFAGRLLDGLSPAELNALAAEVAADPRSLRLLEAYLDRRGSRRREDLHGDTNGRRREAAGQAAMTQEQAYQVLGLEAGAGAEEIHRAYRALMKKLHPDQGGSTYLAAQVNAARDLLLREHR